MLERIVRSGQVGPFAEGSSEALITPSASPKILSRSGSLPRRQIGENPKLIGLRDHRNFTSRARSPPTMAFDLQNSQEIDQWDHAYRRVESYLQACGVAPRVLLTELAVDIIEQARQRAAKDPQGGAHRPVALAMEELFARMTTGFRRAIPADQATEEQLRARGRLALATSGAAPQWAKLLFEKQAEVEQLQQCFNDRPLQAGPELRLSKLPPAQIEYAFGDNDEDLSYAPRRMPVAAMALAIGLVGAMGAAWAVTH